MMKNKTMSHRSSRSMRPNLDRLECRRLMAFSYDYFPIGAGRFSTQTSIVTGPDGNIWFTAPTYIAGDNTTVPASVGEVNVATGAVSAYPIAHSPAGLGSIISGPGGDLWFTDQSGSDATRVVALDSIDPTTHVITSHALNIVNAALAGLAAGPDGNLWFTDPNNVAVGVFDPTTNAATEYVLPKSTDQPYAIVAGPDGNLWFTVGNLQSYQLGFAGPGAIGNINPTTHAFQFFATQNVASGIAVGSDGNIWFNDSAYIGRGNNPPPVSVYRIGDVVPSSGTLTEYAGGAVGPLVSGPGGDLWFSDPQGQSEIGSFDPSTHLSSAVTVPFAADPYGMAAGPGDSLWFNNETPTNEGTYETYLISATVVPADRSSVSGQVYLDPTGTGTTANGPLADVTVYLDLKGDGRLDPGDPITSANPFGYYSFNGVTPGTYAVRVVPYPGNIATSPAGLAQPLTAAAGQNVTAGPARAPADQLAPAAERQRVPLRAEQPRHPDGRGQRPVRADPRPRPRPLRRRGGRVLPQDGRLAGAARDRPLRLDRVRDRGRLALLSDLPPPDRLIRRGRRLGRRDAGRRDPGAGGLRVPELGRVRRPLPRRRDLRPGPLRRRPGPAPVRGGAHLLARLGDDPGRGGRRVPRLVRAGRPRQL